MNSVDENEFLAHIKSEIDANRLVLPTLPDVALKVRQAVDKGTTSASQLADIVATDTALSAKLIQVVNSPLYRGRQHIEKLPVAIARLGSNAVKTLITSLVMQQIFEPDSPELNHYFEKIWEHSVTVSAISRALSSCCNHLDADQSMLAGLIHQIGKLPILMSASQIDGMLDDAASFGQLLENLHPRIGKMIVDAWNFPDSLRPVASEYRDFTRNSSQRADYVDVVQVAYLEAVSEQEQTMDSEKWNAIPAFSKLGLASDIEVLEIEGVSDQVAEAHALLI